MDMPAEMIEVLPTPSRPGLPESRLPPEVSDGPTADQLRESAESVRSYPALRHRWQLGVTWRVGGLSK